MSLHTEISMDVGCVTRYAPDRFSIPRTDPLDVGCVTRYAPGQISISGTDRVGNKGQLSISGIYRVGNELPTLRGLG